MPRWLHSLQFQLPAVTFIAFLGILVFLAALLHEIRVIVTRTHELAMSAEVGDHLAGGITALSVSARERTKYASLGTEHYLQRFRASVQEVEAIHLRIAGSELSEPLKRSQDWRILGETLTRYLSMVEQAASRAVLVEPTLGEKAFRLDGEINERLKTAEQDMREGYFRLQEAMRAERLHELRSLSAAVESARGKVKYSLILLVVMLAYVVIVLKWKILGPLKALEKGAVEVGAGQLGHQVIVPVQNEIGKLAAVFNKMSLQLRDQQTAEVHLKRLETINQLVRSVNHEINNPLMIISANAEYLAAVLENADESNRAKLLSIMDEVQRIFTVTQRLKDIREPVTQDYIDGKDQMIDIVRSSGVWRADWGAQE